LTYEAVLEADEETSLMLERMVADKKARELQATTGSTTTSLKDSPQSSSSRPSSKELLEQEYGTDSGAQQLITLWRSEGSTDEEIYETLRSFW